MPAPANQGLNLSAVDSMVSDFMATEALTEVIVNGGGEHNGLPGLCPILLLTNPDSQTVKW